MNKIIKYSLLTILVLSLLVSAYLIFFFKEQATPEVEIDSPSDSDNAPLGSVEQPIAISEPIFMDEAEKKSLKINPSLKIQVLERDDDGKILSYKIINSDEDIAGGYYPARGK
jgi:hypothetical protein